MSQEKAIAVAVERELRARGYDDYPADQELFQEAIDDITAAILKVIGKSEETTKLTLDPEVQAARKNSSEYWGTGHP